jgi:hypothetical protein
MDYNDQYLLSLIKKLITKVDLIGSQVSTITSIVTLGSQIYEGTNDPVTSGFLPQDASKPAYFNLYAVDGTPIAVRWWDATHQVWK